MQNLVGGGGGGLGGGKQGALWEMCKWRKCFVCAFALIAN